ncbi:MAG: class I SAM-dependent methyltransferase [Kiritimatiellia bacterium]|jgi:cyclopropane fatty-acyl-phospholipid synthase-like methyltransferase|nr:class I SAM-dependent methyltransferase [Kiritimatiellia bacterium]
MYNHDFYNEVQGNAGHSATAVVNLFLAHVHCQSVVDVGCARGTWLDAFVRAGIQDVMGVDGEWVSLDTLDIPQDRFVRADLSKSFVLNRRFDVVVCLEVAEHLPKTAAETLVQSLVTHSDIILFSAAIPYQPGTNHINCQWPAYWAKHFAKHGYVASDFLRPQLWHMSQVGLPYRQNIILYINSNSLEQSRFDKLVIDKLTDSPASRIHPDYYMYIVGKMSAEIDMHTTIRHNLLALKRCFQNKIRNLFLK